MNHKILAGLGLVAVASAFAQYDFETTSAPSAAPVATAPVAAPATATTAPAGAADFDRLRGNAYDIVGNEAAASTVNSWMAKPHNFAGKKLMYIEPTNERGMVSFGEGTTWIAGFDNSASLGKLTVGMAKPAFGVSVDLALGKEWASSKADGTATSDTKTRGDLFGVNYSMPMGGHVLGARTYWLTTADQTSADDGNDEITSSNWDLLLEVNYGNGPSAKDLFWTAGAAILRHQESQESGSVTAIDLDTRTEFTPYFVMGTKVLGNDRARVFLGLNSGLPIQMYDDVKDTRTGRMTVSLLAAPNVLGELALTDNWLMFGGATHTITVVGYGSGSTGTGDTEVTNSNLIMRSGANVATMGLRYQQPLYAFEARLSDNVFSNGPSEIFNGSNVLATFGGFLYF